MAAVGRDAREVRGRRPPGGDRRAGRYGHVRTLWHIEQPTKRLCAPDRIIVIAGALPIASVIAVRGSDRRLRPRLRHRRRRRRLLNDGIGLRYRRRPSRWRVGQSIRGIVEPNVGKASNAQRVQKIHHTRDHPCKPLAWGCGSQQFWRTASLLRQSPSDEPPAFDPFWQPSDYGLCNIQPASVAIMPRGAAPRRKPRARRTVCGWCRRAPRSRSRQHRSPAEATSPRRRPC